MSGPHLLESPLPEMQTTIDTKLLHSLTALRVEAQFRTGRGPTDYSFEGPPLYDYAVAAGIMGEGPSANQYFLITARDGFKVAVAMAEVAPDFSDKQVLIAHTQNGGPVRDEARLVVPGDDLAGRSIAGVASIEVRTVESVPISSAPVSTEVRLCGDLDSPVTHTMDSLRSLPQTSVRPAPSKGHGDLIRPERVFTGPLLHSLLDGAGIQVDESLHEPVLGKVVVAGDADGYAVVIACGEIDPQYQAAPFIVAVADGSGPLRDGDGCLRLVPPYDRAGARHLKGLASLELRDA